MSWRHVIDAGLAATLLAGWCSLAAAGDSLAADGRPLLHLVQDEDYDDEGIEPGDATGIDDDEMIWRIRSLHPNIVDVVFHAVNRSAAWPGGDDVYSLKDSDWHSFRLSCSPGEKICYGAGVRGSYETYWGVGVENTEGCEGCCRTCSGNQVSITLDP